MPTPTPRFLLPQGGAFLRTSQLAIPLRRRPIPFLVRHGSSKPNKPLVLEKPERFNPPSHPSRLVRKPRSYPGPPLSAAEKEQQRTKRYPHMMPPEDSFLHWFLTNKWIHTWISMGVLFALAFWAFLQNFHHTTPYIELLPDRSILLSHPFQFLSRYAEVYRMHSDYISAQNAERRKQKVEDVQKRSEFRKAHGLEDDEGFGGWTARRKGEELGPAIKVEDPQSPVAKSVEEGQAEEEKAEEAPKKSKYRWLGIW